MFPGDGGNKQEDIKALSHETSKQERQDRVLRVRPAVWTLGRLEAGWFFIFMFYIITLCTKWSEYQVRGAARREEHGASVSPGAGAAAPQMYSKQTQTWAQYLPEAPSGLARAGGWVGGGGQIPEFPAGP